MLNNKILLVDDEADALDFLSYNLRKEGYDVTTALDGKTAIKLAKSILPGLIILDVMMPEMDGVEVCKQLRNISETQDTLIVFLTARHEDYSQIAGFEAGADDYLTKPIKPGVLVSRISALLRRQTQYRISNGIQSLGEDLGINKESYTITTGGKSITLPKKEFELLSLLSSRPGKIFNRLIIHNQVWGADILLDNRTIDVHICKIRQKIGEDKIKTFKGMGYKFVN